VNGYFGIGIEDCKTKENIGTLWRSAINLGAAFIFAIGKRYKYQSSDTTKAFRHIPFYEYECLKDFRNPYDCQIIGIEMSEGAKDLRTFCHPKRAIYILGAEDHGLSKECLSKVHQVVKFKSNYCMNVSCAGAIVMWDRQSKGGVSS